MEDIEKVYHYADINKHPHFYGNPNKEGVYITTVQAKEEAENWIGQVQRIFNITNIPDKHKVNTIILRFQGSALKWVSAQEKLGIEFDKMTWEEFKTLFKQQFCYETEKYDRSTAYEFFDFKLEKDMTIAEYTNKFNTLKGQLSGNISEEIALAFYIHGLPNFMKKELDLMRIDSMNLVSQAAETIANRNKELSKNTYYTYTYANSAINKSNYHNQRD